MFVGLISEVEKWTWGQCDGALYLRLILCLGRVIVAIFFNVILYMHILLLKKNNTFAPSHLSMTASEVCAAANQAEQTKIKKYSYITSHAYHSFTPVAFETTGVRGPHSMSFLTDLGRRIVNTTGDKSSLAYLLQKFSVAIQRGNAASVLGTLPPTLFPPLNNNV